MMPKFDGLSDTSQTVFRKNPLHMQQAKQDESNIESSHIADINMARNFARYGGPRPGMVTRSVSEPRLGAAGSAAPSPMGAGMPQGLLTGRSSAGSQADGDDSESASPSSRRFLERRPQFNTHNMLLPGETSLQQAFPGAPGASIGLRSGQQVPVKHRLEAITPHGRGVGRPSGASSAPRPCFMRRCCGTRGAWADLALECRPGVGRPRPQTRTPRRRPPSGPPAPCRERAVPPPQAVSRPSASRLSAAAHRPPAFKRSSA
mmetsp:Transcript_39992/g.128249  ORF Transcript_39992/g.128249 Transcript_39992/m.128249 type:complete len:261 (+) Transcript_39992:132-914(+)